MIVKFKGSWLSLDLNVGKNIYRFNQDNNYTIEIKQEDEGYFRNLLNTTKLYEEVNPDTVTTIFNEILDIKGDVELNKRPQSYPEWSGLKHMTKKTLIKVAKEYYNLDVSPDHTVEEIRAIIKKEMGKRAERNDNV